MMKRARIHSFDEVLQATGEAWEELPHGFRLVVTDDSAAVSGDRIVIPLKPAVARSLKLRAGEVLEATVRGRNLELVRRRRKPAARR